MLGDFPKPFGAAIEEVIVQVVSDLVKATNPAPAGRAIRN
jgi:hypothetical protein